MPSGEDTIQDWHRTLMRDLLGRSQPDPRLAYYDLRYNELTDPLLNNLNFHLAGVRIAMDMLANSVHSHFLRAGQQANALAQEIELARPTARLITNSFRKAQQLVPPKLVRDDIIALPPNFPAIAPGTPTLLLRGVWTWPLTPGNAPRQYLEAYKDFLCDTTGHPWQETGRQRRGRGEPPTPVTQGRWYVPNLNQMRVLDSIAATAGGGDALQGLIKLGVYLPGVTNPIYVLYRGGFAGQDPFRDEESAYRGEIIQHVWQLSRPGRPGGHQTLIVRSSEAPVPIAALFVSSSLSEGSQEQYLSLLGTGTDVKPRIEVRFEGTRAVALANGQQCTLDVTDRVAWESDNPGSIEVSNLPGVHFPSGTLLTTRPGSANIKASFLVDGSKAGSPDGYVTGSNQYSSQSEAQVRNLTITPRNVILTSAGAGKFFCTGFATSTPAGRPTHYALDITPTTQWSLLDPNGLMVPANRATIANGVLTVLDTTLPAGIYTVEARLNGLLDQVKIRLQLQ